MTRRVQALAKGVCDQQKVAADECELLSAHAISSAAADLDDQLIALRRTTTHHLLTLLMSLRKEALTVATAEAKREVQQLCSVLSLRFEGRQVAPNQILASGMNATDTLHAIVLGVFVKHRLSQTDAVAADMSAQLGIRNCTLALVQRNDLLRRDVVAAGVTQAVNSATDAAFQHASEAIDVVRQAEASQRSAWFDEQAELAKQAAIEVRLRYAALHSCVCPLAIAAEVVSRLVWLHRGSGD